MKRWRPASFGLIAALLLGANIARAADLEIAFVGSMTGPHANVALDQLDGFRLGVRHLGGRLGGVEYALTTIDDDHNSALAERAVEDLWKGGKLHILLLSSTAEAAGYLATQAAAHRTLILNLGKAPAGLAGHDCTPNFFSLVPRGDMAQLMAGAYLQGQGFHRLAIMEPPNRLESEAAFKRGFKGEVVDIVSRPSTMDFSPDLEKLAAAKVDAAYFTHGGGMAVEFLQQFAAAGLKAQMPLFGPAGALDQTILAASAPAGLNLFSVGPWSDDLDSPANRRLVADFENDVGRPVSLRAAAGYDAAMLLDAAIRAIDRKVNDTDAFRLMLRRVDFPSTRGSFRFDNDQFPLLTYWVRQVTTDPRGRLINEQRGLLQRDVRDFLAGECPMPVPPPPPPPPPTKR